MRVLLVEVQDKKGWAYCYEQDGIIHRVWTEVRTPLEDLPEGPLSGHAFVPKWKETWPVYSGPNDDSVYLKSPGLGVRRVDCPADRQERNADACTATIARELDHASLFPPHPNLAHFYGCVAKEGYATSIVYERLHSTLEAQVWGMKRVGHRYVELDDDERVPVDPDAVMRDVRAAMAHIRARGLIYVDIKPSNIMWRAHADTHSDHKDEAGGEWCLIDFSECFPPGFVMNQQFGSRGWVDTKARVVTDEVMEAALERLEAFARKGKMPSPLKKPRRARKKRLTPGADGQTDSHAATCCCVIT
jgi:hypothetical protein